MFFKKIRNFFSFERKKKKNIDVDNTVSPADENNTPLDSVPDSKKNKGNNSSIVSPVSEKASSNIYLVGGRKGGVGKSLVSMSVIEYLLDQGKKVFVVDSDTTNPDVMDVYNGSVDVVALNIDKAEGWVKLINLLEENPKSSFVINTGTKLGLAVKENWPVFSSAMGNLIWKNCKRKFITLWVINPQRDGVEFLEEYMANTKSLTFVLLNNYFGEKDRYKFYLQSQTYQDIKQSGGRSYMFPVLFDKFTDKVMIDRIPMHRAVECFSLGEKTQYEHWKSQAFWIFEQLDGRAEKFFGKR